MVSMNDEERNSRPSRWKLLTQTAWVDVYENNVAMPRAWLATQTKALNETETLGVIREGKFADGSKWDPATTALIESPLGGMTAPGAGGTAQITRYAPNQIDLITKSAAPSVLVLSENHYPGWRAYVDGRFVDTLRVDYNLRGVALGPGEHSVEFVYRPKSLMIGVVISMLTMIALCLCSLNAVEARIKKMRLAAAPVR
jgi:hypothetical protein